MKLQQDSSTPLYKQLKEEIKASIENGTLSYGDKIETEIKMSETYNISRVTVRKAVEDLVREGYLTKMQGKGTFVNKPKIQRKIGYLMSFSESCEAMGIKPFSRVIKREILEPTEEMIQEMGLKPGEKVLYINRLRGSSRTPYASENNYYPYPKYAFLMDEKLDQSLYKLLEEKADIQVSSSKGSYLEVVKASGELAKILRVHSSDPLFFIYSRIYDQHGELVHVGKQYLVGSCYKFFLADLKK